MFGRGWEEAEATVVAVKELTSWTGDPSSAFTQSKPHEYVVDVRPPGQSPFRATLRDPYLRGHMAHPDEGQVIRVRFHSKSREVKLITDDWKESTEPASGKDAEDDRFAAAAQGPPGEAPPALEGGSASERLTELGELYEQGKLTDAQYQAEMEKVWQGELGLPKRRKS